MQHIYVHFISSTCFVDLNLDIINKITCKATQQTKYLKWKDKDIGAMETGSFKAK